MRLCLFVPLVQCLGELQYILYFHTEPYEPVSRCGHTIIIECQGSMWLSCNYLQLFLSNTSLYLLLMGHTVTDAVYIDKMETVVMLICTLLGTDTW